jgi:hypothetical protein
MHDIVNLWYREDRETATRAAWDAYSDAAAARAARSRRPLDCCSARPQAHEAGSHPRPARGSARSEGVIKEAPQVKKFPTGDDTEFFYVIEAADGGQYRATVRSSRHVEGRIGYDDEETQLFRTRQEAERWAQEQRRERDRLAGL